MKIKYLLIVALALVCSACSNESSERANRQYIAYYKQFKQPVQINLPDETIDLPVVMAALDKQFAAHNVKSRAPLTTDEISAQSSALPCRLPHLLVKMYQWHDGIDNLIPGYKFLPLSEMVKQYQEILKIKKQVGLVNDEGWSRHYLPVLRLDGKSYYALDCSAIDRSPLYDYFLEDGSARPAYRGIANLLAVTLTAYETGAYFRQGDYINSHPIEFQHAIREHALPVELRIMNANLHIMNKGLTELNGLAFQYLTNSIEDMADPSMIPILENRLHDKNSTTVSSAAFALGLLHAKSAESKLARLLTHPSSDVRNMAASALSDIGQIDSPAVIDKLIALLHNPDDPYDLAKLGAIQALGETHSKKAATELLAMLPHSRPGLQRAIIYSLASIGDRRAISPLRKLLVKVSRMDLSKPDMGGTRGYDPPPSALKRSLEIALKKLGG